MPRHNNGDRMKQWSVKHPVKTGIFCAATIAVALIGASRPGLDWFVFSALCSLGALLMLVMRADGVPWALVFALMLAPSGAKAEEQESPGIQAAGGGAVAGGIVLVGGGLAIYALVKFCAKHFGRVSTNQLPQLNTNNSTTAVWGASYIDPAFGYCISAAAFEEPCIVTIFADVSSGEARITGIEMTTNAGTYADFGELALAYGLSTNGLTYTSNAVPISEFESPIQLTSERSFRIRNGIDVTVQESRDLIAWDFVANISVPDGRLIFTDQTAGDRRFYRLQTTAH